MVEFMTLLAQASQTPEDGNPLGGLMLLVIIGILIAIFNSGKKKKVYDVRLDGEVKER